MSTTRHFLAFTAGAVAARTVLPIAAGAKSVQIDQISHPDAKLVHLGDLLDTAAANEQRAWMRSFPAKMTTIILPEFRPTGHARRPARLRRPS